MSTPTIPDQSWQAVGEIAQPKDVENYLIAEIYKALGLPGDSRWCAWLRPVLGKMIRGFAVKAAAFDQSVAQHGFQVSSQRWLEKWVAGISIQGWDQVPSSGPLLIAANHPGAYDALGVASVVPRQDLKIVVAGNPFFRSLPNVRKHFIFSTLDTYVRMTTIRNAIRHLQSGASLLIFPSGRVDPDPLYFKQEAKQAVGSWSESLELILRRVPQSRLLVAINTGFVAPKYLRNPLLRLHPRIMQRQKIAEVFQIIQQVVYDRWLSHRPIISFSDITNFREPLSEQIGFRNLLMTCIQELIDRN